MKKLLAAFLVLGLFAGVAYAYGRSPERSACLKLADLCAPKAKGGVDDLEQCVDQFKQFRKAVGDEAVDKGLSCVEKASTCPQAVGCVAGAGVKGMSGALKEFAKGFDEALSK
ncbi:MAG: hypothetical protein ACXWUG_06625 [Polyangiales bacterium]